MVTPKLLLLTGPAADDVAQVLYNGTTVADSRQGASCEPWWDEVRDYWDAPHYIAGIPDSVAIEHGIRSLPGGEEWLVRLVLPAAHMTEPLNLTCGHSNVGKSFTLDCSTCRNYRNLPARLAILAPEPPPLLVERVRAWGGEMWHCGTDILSEQMWEDCPEFQPCIIVGNTSFTEHTWPEAVRAALGEAE